MTSKSIKVSNVEDMTTEVTSAENMDFDGEKEEAGDTDTSNVARLPDEACATRPRAPPHENVPENSPSIEGMVFHRGDLNSESLKALFNYFDDSSAETENQQKPAGLEMVVGAFKMSEKEFLPRQIFIRDCMKKVFGYFRDDILDLNSNRVLLGSPGVGKSVLFFICALYKADTTDTPVAYFRKTREEKKMSVFIMFRTEQGLRVFWTRDVSKNKFKTIADLRDAISEGFGRDIVVFLDGPRHDAEKDLNSFYEYFCTSGGHPLPKNAQKDLYLWILDGWTERELLSFGTLLGKPQEYMQAYEVFGGCIRDIVAFVNGNDKTRQNTKETLRALVNRVASSQVDLVLNHTTRDNDDDNGSPGRLRTMFNGETVSIAIPDAIQIIDSSYVLQLLRGRLSMNSYFTALNRGKAIKSGSVVGVYFEEILHQWFKEFPPRDIAKVRVSTGTTIEGLGQLVETNTYWIPSLPNFPNIDAAVVIEGVLYCFQYTKKSGHGFNVDTFLQGFVEVVRARLEFGRIHVYIVMMDDVSSTLAVNFSKKLTISSGTRASAMLVDICCTSSQVNIDTTTIDTIRSSALSGFSFHHTE